MKPTAPNPEINRQILDEASEWFVDFRVGDVDSVARKRFDEWLRRSPEHIRAYWEIARIYVDLPPATAFGRLNSEELIAYAHSDANVVSLHAPPNEAHPLRLENARDPLNEGGAAGCPPRRFRRPFLAAAAVAFAFVLGAAVWWQAHRYPLYATDIGERRLITLADGSTVDLNARSQLRVEFSNAERRVELLTGQALFQVAKDKARPFIVHSGDATVRAVGTQFDVFRKDSGTTVTVLEGRVAVYSSADLTSSAPPPGSASTNAASERALPSASTRDSHSASASDSSGSTGLVPSNSDLSGPSGFGAVFLAAGEQTTVTATAIVSPHRADAEAATAWLQRKLIFEGSRLSDVVDEFNRYNHTQLVIEDPKLRDFEISGVYASTDPASLIRFLQDQGLRVTSEENEVRINEQ